MDQAKAAGIKLLVSDVDGVLTDGSLFYGSGNLEIKGFNIHDGVAMKMAWQRQFPVVWLTGRKSEAVTRRADELNVQLYQGLGDKDAGLRAIAADKGVELSEIAYLGDDLNDLPALRIAGFPVAVADAAPEVKALAAYVTTVDGGRGALRELVEVIFKAQGIWDESVEAYLASLRGMRITPGNKKR